LHLAQRLAGVERGQHAGQRPVEGRLAVRRPGVADDGQAEPRMLGEMPVGADRDKRNLRREPRRGMGGEGGAVPRQQALVDASHARAPAAGENKTADGGGVDLHPPM
jgi:hypothetical protein